MDAYKLFIVFLPKISNANDVTYFDVFYMFISNAFTLCNIKACKCLKFRIRISLNFNGKKKIYLKIYIPWKSKKFLGESLWYKVTESGNADIISLTKTISIKLEINFQFELDNKYHQTNFDWAQKVRWLI